MSTGKILYVEDEEDLREMASIFFTEEGLEVDSCGGMAQAIDLLRENTYAVIVTDFHLPSCSGLELLRYAKSECAFSGKSVLLTGSIIEAGDRGFDDFDLVVHKPIDFLELIDQLRKYL